jgi:hypothetical protein
MGCYAALFCQRACSMMVDMHDVKCVLHARLQLVSDKTWQESTPCWQQKDATRVPHAMLLMLARVAAAHSLLQPTLPLSTVANTLHAALHQTH